MPELQKMPERMQERIQKPSFSTVFSRHSKALKLAGIITISSMITGCATSNYNVRASNDTVKNEYTQQKTVSAETTIKENGSHYLIKYETNDDLDYLVMYVDGEFLQKKDISKFIKENFSDKFTDREIVMGKRQMNDKVIENPSMIIKGIDGKGNYGYLLFSKVYGEKIITPITSDFNAEILKNRGVEVKCIYNEKNTTWRISYNKGETEIGYGIFDESGKILQRDATKEFEELYNKEEKR